MSEKVMVLMSVGELETVVNGMVDKILNYHRQPLNIGGEPVKAYHDTVNTNVAKKLLKSKGWRVQSKVALNSVLAEYGVKAVKKGRENWYVTKQIEAIPDKK